MRVINNTSYPVIAFGTETRLGYGEDVTVQPGEFADVSGPYVGESGGAGGGVGEEGNVMASESMNKSARSFIAS